MTLLSVINILCDLYSSVICHWNRQLKPYLFPLRKNRVNQVHLLPPLSAIGLINILSYLYSSVIHHWNRQLKPYLFPPRKYRVNQGHNLPPLSVLVLGLRYVLFMRLTDFVSYSVRLCHQVSQTLSVSHSDFSR